MSEEEALILSDNFEVRLGYSRWFIDLQPNIKKLTIPDLKNVLKGIKGRTTGNKAELVKVLPSGGYTRNEARLTSF